MRKQSFSIGELTVDYIRGGGLDPFTKRFYVDPTNGSDGNDGHSITHAKKSFAAAKALLTAAKNQVLYVLPGSSGLVVTSAQDWDLAATNLIGLGQQRMNNRARIYTVTAGSMTPLMTVSAANCMFANLMFSQEGTHATGNAVSLYVSGHRNYFENISLRNVDGTALADASYRALKLGSIYDTFFVKCQIGDDSQSSGTNFTIEMAGTESGKYVFEDCMIISRHGTAGSFVKIGNSAGGFTLFTRCKFINTVTTLTQAFSIGSANAPVILDRCLILGAGALETSDSGVLFGDNVDAAATTAKGIALTW